MRFFKTLHLLSLDVVLGACLFQYLITAIFIPGQYPPLLVTFALALIVWTIYLVDRLIDNQKPVDNSILHDFHLKHACKIKYLIGCNIILISFIIIYLPIYLIIYGLGIGFLMLVYWTFLILGFFDRFKYIKEISTAFIYTLGIFLYAILNWVEGSILVIVTIMVLFFLLALQNIVLFTLLSKKNLGEDLTLRCVEALFICLWMAIFYFTPISIFLLLPFFITFVIHLWIHYISKSKRWAWLGEVAFFSPLFYYIYAIIST